MKDQLYNVQIQLAEINCGKCGGTYAINDRYRQAKSEEGGSWNCPYCQIGWGYSNDSENARLKKQLAEKEAQLARERMRTDTAKADARKLTNELNAQKSAKSRLKNRIANGVCPCCNRSFSNLHSHMKKQHPDFNETAK